MILLAAFATPDRPKTRHLEALSQLARPSRAPSAGQPHDAPTLDAWSDFRVGRRNALHLGVPGALGVNGCAG
jgi:hypothetical protein